MNIKIRFKNDIDDIEYLKKVYVKKVFKNLDFIIDGDCLKAYHKNQCIYYGKSNSLNGYIWSTPLKKKDERK